MPNYDFQCRVCHAVFEQIVASEITLVPCRTCINGPADRQISAPGGIRANGAEGGMVLSEKQMKKIKEPVWQDEKTGAVTAVH